MKRARTVVASSVPDQVPQLTVEQLVGMAARDPDKFVLVLAALVRQNDAYGEAFHDVMRGIRELRGLKEERARALQHLKLLAWLVEHDPACCNFVLTHIDECIPFAQGVSRTVDSDAASGAGEPDVVSFFRRLILRWDDLFGPTSRSLQMHAAMLRSGSRVDASPLSGDDLLAHITLPAKTQVQALSEREVLRLQSDLMAACGRGSDSDDGTETVVSADSQQPAFAYSSLFATIDASLGQAAAMIACVDPAWADKYCKPLRLPSARFGQAVSASNTTSFHASGDYSDAEWEHGSEEGGEGDAVGDAGDTAVEVWEDVETSEPVLAALEPTSSTSTSASALNNNLVPGGSGTPASTVLQELAPDLRALVKLSAKRYMPPLLHLHQRLEAVGDTQLESKRVSVVELQLMQDTYLPVLEGYIQRLENLKHKAIALGIVPPDRAEVPPASSSNGSGGGAGAGSSSASTTSAEDAAAAGAATLQAALDWQRRHHASLLTKDVLEMLHGPGGGELPPLPPVHSAAVTRGRGVRGRGGGRWQYIDAATRLRAAIRSMNNKK